MDKRDSGEEFVTYPTLMMDELLWLDTLIYTRGGKDCYGLEEGGSMCCVVVTKRREESKGLVANC